MTKLPSSKGLSLMKLDSDLKTANTMNRFKILVLAFGDEEHHVFRRKITSYLFKFLKILSVQLIGYLR
jgi:hypothetical protein